jgi:hypothetical protein
MSTTALRSVCLPKSKSSSETEKTSIASWLEVLQKTVALAAQRPLERRQVIGELALHDARELLDWLENNGVDQFNVEIEESGKFKVVWTERFYAK